MLRLTRDVYEEIVAHAREGTPEEVCGVLGGEHGTPAPRTGRTGSEASGEHGEESHAVTLRRAENVAAAPRARYELDPAEQLQLMEDLENEGHEIVGFYHSHPRGPEGPSATDAAQAAWEGYSYVICSLAGEPSVGSWRWRGDGDGFEREAVVVEGDRTGVD